MNTTVRSRGGSAGAGTRGGPRGVAIADGVFEAFLVRTFFCEKSLHRRDALSAAFWVLESCLHLGIFHLPEYVSNGKTYGEIKGRNILGRKEYMRETKG